MLDNPFRQLIMKAGCDFINCIFFSEVVIEMCCSLRNAFEDA